MIFGRERFLKREIIGVGKKLYALRLVTATAGNLSARLDEKHILVTVTGAALGNLTDKDILKIDLSQTEKALDSRLTTEFGLHRLIYQNYSAKVIIHCHPSLINAYFAVCSELKPLTFESKLYLGNVPVVIQETPSVTKPELVTQALNENNLVVIKNHGVVAVADKFSQALYLIEMLEEAIRVAAVARLFKKDALDTLDKELKEEFSQDKSYSMFSYEHIQAIVDLVNRDEFIRKKGEELDLTLKLAIKMDGKDEAYKFNFEKGRITRLDYDEDAPFVISAPSDVWELVFLGRLDPFVATTQGKMKLKGQLGQLSRWYVPFSRLFELFRQVKIK